MWRFNSIENANNNVSTLETCFAGSLKTWTKQEVAQDMKFKESAGRAIVMASGKS